MSSGRKLILALLAVAALAGCRQKMANQPRYDPYEASDFFSDGMAARPRVEGTVARGELVTNPFLETGKVNGQPGDGYPFPIDEQVMNRGHQRYDIYCAQCHGRLGDGNGMIVARGFRRPPSFHNATLRAQTTGHFFDVMTNGFGAMPPYRTMIAPRDRWAIIAYIRALQISQSATVNDVPADRRAELDSPAEAGATKAHGGGH